MVELVPNIPSEDNSQKLPPQPPLPAPWEQQLGNTAGILSQTWWNIWIMALGSSTEFLPEKSPENLSKQLNVFCHAGINTLVGLVCSYGLHSESSEKLFMESISKKFKEHRDMLKHMETKAKEQQAKQQEQTQPETPKGN